MLLQQQAAETEGMGEKINSAIQNAEEVCEDGSTQECATAWDEVEELSAEAAHQREKSYFQEPSSSDPLEEYCNESPDADGTHP